MVKKQKFLRNLLTSVSVASIIASIGGSSVAFAADVKDGGNLSDIWVGADLTKDWVVFNQDTGGAAVLTVDYRPATPDTILGINARYAGTIRIEKDISIGEIISAADGVGGPGGDNLMLATINAARTLTLGKEKDHTG